LANEIVSLGLAAALIASVLVALFSRKVSISLIALFYSSVMLGITFTVYGDTLLGLLQMATFAGAVSVLILSVILMTGESRLNIGARELGVALGAVILVMAAYLFVGITGGAGPSPSATYSDISVQVLGFLWQFRPWDLLILVTVFASAMVTIVNLFSREQ
jgi:NADH:ubiquinone oxidoreductase subunit 6 (subunit J)